MGLKNAINAANRYAENSDILDKVSEGKIGWGTPEHKQQWNYFVTSGDSGDDIHTIYELAAKSLKANGKKINEENLRHFFDSLIQTYVSQEQSSSSPEQMADDAINFKAGSPGHLAYIEKQYPGTIDKWLTNKLKDKQLTNKLKEKHFDEEQMADLRNLLDGVQGVM